MTNILRKRVLIWLMLFELLCIGVLIYTIIATWDYTWEIAFAGVTTPWIGNNLDTLSDRYNVELMQALIIVGTISEWLFVIANLVRFVFLTQKYKIIFGVGTVAFIAGILCANFDILNGFTGSLFIVGVICIVYSHWLGKEYKNIIEQESEPSNEQN